MKMLAIADVWQLDIMDEFELLIVLSGWCPLSLERQMSELMKF